MPHLPEALASIARQTFEDFEVIAVDDGSVDETAAKLRDWAARDSRIRIVSGPARGLVPALERARATARGRYLARMDSDDRAHESRFELQHALMEASPTTGLCGTHVRYFPEASVRDGTRRYEGWLNALTTAADLERDLFVECPLAHPTLFMRAEVVEALGGYRDAGWPEDYDLVLRAWEAQVGLAVVPEVLHDWREGPERLSRRSPVYAIEAFRRCKVAYLIRTHLKSTDEVFIWGAGPTGKAFGRLLLEHGRKIAGWVDVDPRKIGQSIHGAPVLEPDRMTPAVGRMVLAAVAQPGAREEVRETLRSAGFREPGDVVAIA